MSEDTVSLEAARRMVAGAVKAALAMAEKIARDEEAAVIDNEHYDPGAIRETARDIADRIADLKIVSADIFRTPPDA